MSVRLLQLVTLKEKHTKDRSGQRAKTCCNNLPQKSARTNQPLEKKGVEGWLSAGFLLTLWLYAPLNTLQRNKLSVFCPDGIKIVGWASEKGSEPPAAESSASQSFSRSGFPQSISAETHCFPRVWRFRHGGSVVTYTKRNKTFRPQDTNPHLLLLMFIIECKIQKLWQKNLFANICPTSTLYPDPFMFRMFPVVQCPPNSSQILGHFEF